MAASGSRCARNMYRVTARRASNASGIAGDRIASTAGNVATAIAIIAGVTAR